MKEQTQRIVLMITVGAQDVKLWKQTKDGPDVEQISRPVRQKHLAIRNSTSAWAVLNKEEVANQRIQESSSARAGQELANLLDCPDPLFTADGRLCLAVPKIESIVDSIAALKNEIEVVGALIFYTERLQQYRERGTDPEYAKEPVASAEVVSRYLEKRFALGSDWVVRVNGFEGLVGRYEGGVEDHDDLPLRRAIVHRLDKAVKAFIDENKATSFSDVIPVLMTTGGMDPFKQVVPAIAELRFSQRVRDLSVPEVLKGTFPDWVGLVRERLSPSRIRITRHEAISARGQALELIHRGDPLGAWAAVARFRGSKQDAWWIIPLRETAAYFGGFDRQAGQGLKHLPEKAAEDSATKAWLSSIEEIGLDVTSELERHRRFALNAAMRAELALQGPDNESRRLTDALGAVCTMIDAAVIARAWRYLYGDKEDPYDSDRKLEIEKFIKDSPKLGRKDFFDKADSKLPNNSRNVWYGGSVKSLDEVLGRKLEKRFSALIELEKALSRTEQKKSLRQLRNTASHRALAREDVKIIASLASKDNVKLWEKEVQNQWGYNILAPPAKGRSCGHVHLVLKSIGVPDAARKYRILFENLVNILQAVEAESNQ